jgi:hypothetical protein
VKQKVINKYKFVNYYSFGLGVGVFTGQIFNLVR